MPMSKSGMLCVSHGGTVEQHNASWLCDMCAIQNYTKCACGGNVRGFGEAMMSMAGCENCDQSLTVFGHDVQRLWNLGLRGNPTQDQIEQALSEAKSA